jgi:hypothetical protein
MGTITQEMRDKSRNRKHDHSFVTDTVRKSVHQLHGSELELWHARIEAIMNREPLKVEPAVRRSVV